MNVLFIAYQAASDPLMESQGFSYMRKIAEKEVVQYSLLTFETKDSLVSSKEYIEGLKNAVKWKYLLYRNKPRFPATCLNILSGIITVISIVRKNNINTIHARGLFSALIAYVPAKLFNIKLLFDTRGLLADKYVGGKLLSENGLLYKLIRWGERILLEKCDMFTVETNRHAEIINKSLSHLTAKMKVIPCCVDMDKFNYVQNKKNGGSYFKLVYLGKSGTWYLTNEMLDLFKVITSEMPNAKFIFLTQNEPSIFYQAARAKGISVSQINIIKPNMADVSKLLAETDTGVFFINSYKRYNSSPVKFGEYLACGLPVVLNAGIGDCDEIITKERIGIIIHEYTEREYKRAIYELNTLLSEGEALRKRCRNAAAKYFSLEMGAEKYWEVYTRILST